VLLHKDDCPTPESKSFVNNVSGVTGVGIGFKFLRPLVDDFAVLVRDRNRLRRGRDSVPQRLQVVDLLFDRKVVKSWGGSGTGF
jgi:hypothetical protein